MVLFYMEGYAFNLSRSLKFIFRVLIRLQCVLFSLIFQINNAISSVHINFMFIFTSCKVQICISGVRVQEEQKEDL